MTSVVVFVIRVQPTSRIEFEIHSTKVRSGSVGGTWYIKVIFHSSVGNLLIFPYKFSDKKNMKRKSFIFFTKFVALSLRQKAILLPSENDKIFSNYFYLKDVFFSAHWKIMNKFYDILKGYFYPKKRLKPTQT